MGELAGTFNDSPEGQIAQDRDQASQEEPQGIETNVTDVYADAINKRDNLPIFKVSHDEFFQNMEFGRKRLRFKSGTNVQKFMRGSRYNAPFWIQHEKNGHIRKVK